MWSTPAWLPWLGTALALLVLLLACRRRGAGAFLLLPAAAACAWALHRPALTRRVDPPARLLVGVPAKLDAAREVELAGAVAAARRRRGPYLESRRRLLPGTGGGDAIRWEGLAALLAAAAGPGERLDLVAAPAGPLRGTMAPTLPAGTLDWFHLLPSQAPVSPGTPLPRLTAFLPRRPRAGRPWLLLAAGHRWPPGTELRVALTFTGGGNEVAHEGGTRVGPEGRVLLRLEPPPLPAGPGLLRLHGRAGRAEADWSRPVRVAPAPRVALPAGSGLVPLVRAQGFRVAEFVPGQPLPAGAELLLWERARAKEAAAADLVSFLDRGGGVLAAGKGLTGLAQVPGLASRLPLFPLSPRREAGQEETPGPAGEPPEPPPETSPPEPPPPARVKEPPEEMLARTASVVLILDVSGSMRELLPTVKEACRQTALALDGKDRLAIVSLAEEARVLLPMGYADRRKQIQASLEGLVPTGVTLLRPPVETARRLLAGEKSALKLVLLFTDGMVEWDRASRGSGRGADLWFPADQMNAELLEQGILVSAVIYDPDCGYKGLQLSRAREKGARLLDRLVFGTGGNVKRVADRKKVVQAFLAEARRVSTRRKEKEEGKEQPEKGERGEEPPVRRPPPKENRSVPADTPREIPVFLTSPGWVVSTLPSALPPLARLFPARETPLAAWVPLRAGGGRLPLLAFAPPALARTAVWSGGWNREEAGRWRRRGLLRPLFGRILTALLRPLPPEPVPSCRWTGTGGDLLVAWPWWGGDRPARVALAGPAAGGEALLAARWPACRRPRLAAPARIGGGEARLTAGGRTCHLHLPPRPDWAARSQAELVRRLEEGRAGTPPPPRPLRRPLTLLLCLVALGAAMLAVLAERRSRS